MLSFKSLNILMTPKQQGVNTVGERAPLSNLLRKISMQQWCCRVPFIASCSEYNAAGKKIGMHTNAASARPILLRAPVEEHLAALAGLEAGAFTLKPWGSQAEQRVCGRLEPRVCVPPVREE